MVSHSFSQEYTASTDGIVMATQKYVSNWPVMKVYVNGEFLMQEGGDDDGGTEASLTFPVKMGDTWEVRLNGNSQDKNLQWMPFECSGTGGNSGSSGNFGGGALSGTLCGVAPWGSGENEDNAAKCNGVTLPDCPEGYTYQYFQMSSKSRWGSCVKDATESSSSSTQIIRWDKWVQGRCNGGFGSMRCNDGWIQVAGGHWTSSSDNEKSQIRCVRVDPTYSYDAIKYPDSTCSEHSSSDNPYGD
jgi:hypothetical protein